MVRCSCLKSEMGGTFNLNVRNRRKDELGQSSTKSQFSIEIPRENAERKEFQKLFWYLREIKALSATFKQKKHCENIVTHSLHQLVAVMHQIVNC